MAIEHYTVVKERDSSPLYISLDLTYSMRSLTICRGVSTSDRKSHPCVTCSMSGQHISPNQKVHIISNRCRYFKNFSSKMIFQLFTFVGLYFGLVSNEKSTSVLLYIMFMYQTSPTKRLSRFWMHCIFRTTCIQKTKKWQECMNNELLNFFSKWQVYMFKLFHVK